MSENIVENQEFSVEETDVSFKIGGVECLDKVIAVEWDKELLDGGNSHTQDEKFPFTAKQLARFFSENYEDYYL